ncbi:MAG: ABC transporter permease, partial [Thermomicrobiales bacterium]
MTAPATTLQNAPPPAALESEVPHRSGRRGLDRKRLVLWSLPILFFIAAAIIGPYIWPYDSLEVRTGDRLQPPLAILKDGSRAWLGTDKVGRDILAQILEGARISLIVGGATIFLAGSIGLTFGVLAGYRGGFSDSLLMRLADIQLAFPSILLAIMIAAVLGPSVTNVILTLSLTRWVIFARVARAATLTAKEREYVLAARATGVPPLRMLVKHIIPATIPPLLVIATVEV